MKSTQPSNPASSDPLAAGSSSFEGGSSEAPRFDTSSVKGLAGDAKRAAGNALTQAKERASTLASDQKQSAADRINRCSSALRDSARSMENDDPNIAHYANLAAERIERVADYVRSTDFEGLRRDAEDIARRHPALFMGGMFLAGIVLGGLVKTSAKAIREQNSASSFDPMESDYAASASFDPMSSGAPTASGI